MLSNLGDFLDYAEIKYKEINKNKFRILIEGGSILYMSKNENKINFLFHEFGGDRILKIEIDYFTEEDEDVLAEFIKTLIEFLNETEGQFFELTSEKLKDILDSKLNHIFNNYKIEIKGENPALNFGYFEKPLTKEEIIELRNKAASEKNKEEWQKYQNMLINLDSKNENNSLKYLKKFKNYFDK
jgi:hypothetical protein